MRGSDFIFVCLNLLHYKCDKINIKRGGSYIDSPDWIKKKKATMNTFIDDNKWFQYAATIALNYEEIGKIREKYHRLIKPFRSKYNWKGINYPSG